MELLVNINDLRAPTLVGPTWFYPGSEPPSCTTPRQHTLNKASFYLTFKKCLHNIFKVGRNNAPLDFDPGPTLGHHKS